MADEVDMTQEKKLKAGGWKSQREFDKAILKLFKNIGYGKEARRALRIIQLRRWADQLTKWLMK